MPPGAPPGSPATWPCVTAFFWRCSPAPTAGPPPSAWPAPDGRTEKRRPGRRASAPPGHGDQTPAHLPRLFRRHLAQFVHQCDRARDQRRGGRSPGGDRPLPQRAGRPPRPDPGHRSPAGARTEVAGGLLRDTGQRLHRHPRAEAGGPRHPGHRKDARPAAIGSSQLGRGASTCDGGSGGSTGALSSAGTSGTGASGCQGSGPRLGSWKVTKQPPAWGCPATDPPT